MGQALIKIAGILHEPPSPDVFMFGFGYAVLPFSAFCGQATETNGKQYDLVLGARSGQKRNSFNSTSSPASRCRQQNIPQPFDAVNDSSGVSKGWSTQHVECRTDV